MKIKKQPEYKTYTYSTENNFMVDIIAKEDYYEAWIYKKDIGIKDFMFGIPKLQNNYQEMEELVEIELWTYMDEYEEQYGDK